MLNDTVIHIFQGMLQKQYPRINGLQDPVLGQNLSFSMNKNKPFVHVLHDGDRHWIAVSTLGCEPGEIVYMDRLFSGRISEQVKQQICAIMHSPVSELKVRFISVQKQRNGVDCGIFVLALITYLMQTERYPTTVAFDQIKMRHHFLRSLAVNRLESFPEQTCEVRRCNEKVINIQLYCNCAMFWIPSDRHIFGRYILC